VRWPTQQRRGWHVTGDVQTSLVLTMDDFGTLHGASSTEMPTGAVARHEAVRSPATAVTVAAIYDALHVELFGFALRSTRDAAAAEDLLHEAFVRLIVEIDAGRTPDQPRAWLYRVVANLAVSRGRRASVAQRHVHALAQRETEADGPEPHVLDDERRADLESMLAALQPDARTALLMAAQGFDGSAIAIAIGRTELATRSLMWRARIQLRQLLAASDWAR
jgi:RNA polymerase sigma-70 factor (ECF subfamily)